MPKNNELYYVGKDGQNHDAELHDEILDNPEAFTASCANAVQQAVKSGMSGEDAARLYGHALPGDAKTLQGTDYANGDEPWHKHVRDIEQSPLQLDEVRRGKWDSKDDEELGPAIRHVKKTYGNHRILYRGMTQKMHGGFLPASRGRFGPGVYLTDIRNNAKAYGTYILICTIKGKIFDTRKRLSVEDESAVMKHMSDEALARLKADKGWYKTDGEAFWESLRRAVRGDDGKGDERAVKLLQQAGFDAIEGLGDGHEMNVFDPKNVVLLSESEDTASLWINRNGHLVKADFVESEHPRASDGEFTKGYAGVKVTHTLFPAVVNGKQVDLPEHIRKLKLPPAWTDVHYNPDPSAALLAIGKDAKGRAQYVYSDEHVSQQAIAKFHRVRELDNKFTSIQSQNERNKRSEDQRTREHADCLDLIMQTGIRPGSEDDTSAEKKAYGATTLIGSHVTKENDGVVLKFVGKKGVDLSIPVTDKELAARLLTRAKAVGPEGKLFGGVSDDSLRKYSHMLGGGGFKVKDFRTLHATKSAQQVIKEMNISPTTPRAYKKAVMEVAKKVSSLLGNTPVVCLQSYLDSSIFTEWRLTAGV